MTLENQPQHVQLAVDLIQLLEESKLEPRVILTALAIVQQDFENKME